MKTLTIHLFALFFFGISAGFCNTDPLQASDTLLTNQQKQELLADSLMRAGLPDDALKAWQALAADAGSTKEQKIRAANEQGDILRVQGKMEEALQLLEQTNEQIDSSIGMKMLKAQNLLYWGRCQLANASADSAVLSFRNAAYLAAEAQDHTLLFLSLIELGTFYHKNKKNDLAAVYYYSRALRLSEEGHVKISDMTAHISYDLSLIARSLNEREKAIDNCKEALSLMDSLQQPANYSFVADVNYQLATLYVSMNENDEAIPYLKKAIELRHSHAPEDSIYDVQFYLPALSAAYQAINQTDSAILIENQLAELQGVTVAGQGSANKHRLAELYLQNGNIPLANRLINSYFKYYKDSTLTSQGRLRALLLKGDYYAVTENLDSALFYYNRCLSLIDPAMSLQSLADKKSERGKLPPLTAAAMEKAAIAYSLSAEKIDSAEQLTQALQLFETTLDNLRHQTLSNFSDALLTANRVSHFHTLTEYALNVAWHLYTLSNNNLVLRKAFYLMENDKLLTIRIESAEAMFLNYVGLPGSVTTEFVALNKQILERIDQLDLSINIGERLEREALLIESYEKMIKWRESSRRYISGNYSQFDLFDNVRFADLHNHEGIHLVEYFYGTKWLFGLGISDNENKFIRREISDSFRKDIYSFLAHFWRTPKVFSQADLEHFVASSHFLFRDIVEPLLPPLPCEKKIVFVPDGLIKLIPFETLLTEKPANPRGYHTLPYLIRTALVSYITSSEMLVDLPPALPKYNSQLISFALKGKYTALDSASLYIAKELKSSRLYYEGLTFRGIQATKDIFIRAAPSFEIIYLLIHGDAIDYPKLVFNAGTSSNVERNLYTHEINNLNLPGNLVVLTSTETGMGLIPHGEAIVSMVRAFLSAGCGAVVLGLWEAHDEYSKNIIGKFYKNLALGKNNLNALRDSKLEFLESSDKLSAHPHNWAELISYGEPVTVSIEKDRGYLVYFMAVMILFSLGACLAVENKSNLQRIMKKEQKRGHLL